MNNPAACARIKTEIDLHRSVDHPNIVKLHSVHETKNHIILKLEYARGLELHHLCYKTMSEPEAQKLTKQLLTALEYLHSKYIIHLDIKPQNIIVTDDGQIKLLDLGIARKFVWAEKVSAGTPGYMAPEVLREHKANDRADVFSCGVVFYAMLSGKLPYQKAYLT